MANSIYFIVCIAIYLIVLLFFTVKAIDIFNNSSKYNKFSNWTKYYRSFWYEAESEYFTKGFFSKNYWAPIITLMPMCAIFVTLYYYGSILIQKVAFVPSEAILFRTDDFYWGVIAAIFYAIIFVFWITFNSNIPIFIASSVFAFNSKSRSTDWKKLISVILILSALCIPVMAFSTNCYGYITSKSISYNYFTNIHETVFNYDGIVYAETSYTSNKDRTDFYFSYVITDDNGNKFDIFKSGSKNVLLIDDYLAENNLNIHKADIDKNTYKQMLIYCPKETIKAINQCFIIE